MPRARKTYPLVEKCRNAASALTDGTAAFPEWLEPGEFDPMINQLYRIADVIERSIVSLGLEFPADADRIGRLQCSRTAKKLLERAGVQSL